MWNNMYIMLNVFWEIKSLSFLKLKKPHRNIFTRKNTDSLKRKELRLLKELFSSYDTDSFEKSFFNRWVILLRNKILSKTFYNGLCDEKWPKIMILDIFSLSVSGYVRNHFRQFHLAYDFGIQVEHLVQKGK